MEKGIRRLCWFTLGFGAALACIVLLCWDQAGLLTAAGWALAIPALALSRRHCSIRRLSALLLGFGAGAGMLLCLQKISYDPLLSLDGTLQEAEILCGKDSTPGRYSHSAEGTVTIDGKTRGVRVYLPEGATARAGDRITGTFRWSVTLPGGSKASGGSSGRGVFLTASPKGETTLTPGTQSLWTLPQTLARAARQAISRCFPEDAAPFAQSLLLGDTQDLSYIDETALRVSGIRHIVAVSGLHVAMLFGIIWLLSGKTPWPAFIVGLPVLWLFAAAAGFTSSVCRACIMSGLLVLAKLTRRAYDPKTALAAAALGLMVANPFVIAAPGFQLSVLSVLGILLFQQPLAGYFRQHLPQKGGRFSQGAADSLSVSLSAMALSTPISAWYFGVISLVGVLTNLLTLWLLPVIFGGILGVCILGPIFPALGTFLGSIIAWPIRLVLYTARTLSRLPMAAVYTCSKWSVCWLIVAYGLVGAWCLCRKKQGKIFFATALAGLAISAVLTGYGPRTDDCRLTVLDVGEGQCLLLQSAGENALIDCGGDSDTKSADLAWQMLRSQNFYHLDVLAQTHFDWDHVGGTAHFLTQIPAETVLLPGEDPDLSGALLTEDTEIPFGTGVLRFYPYTGGNSRQENSMVILFESGNCVILITGDLDMAGERRLLRQGVLPKTDILVVGHHGSKYSTCPELLETTKPELAVISVGAKNHYGHPAQELLDRLEDTGCDIRRTDREGTILIRREDCGKKTSIGG